MFFAKCVFIALLTILLTSFINILFIIFYFKLFFPNKKERECSFDSLSIQETILFVKYITFKENLVSLSFDALLFWRWYRFYNKLWNDFIKKYASFDDFITEELFAEIQDEIERDSIALWDKSDSNLYFSTLKNAYFAKINNNRRTKKDL